MINDVLEGWNELVGVMNGRISVYYVAYRACVSLPLCPL